MTAEHVHQQRFDGDDPYLICECGSRWDARTGAPITRVEDTSVFDHEVEHDEHGVSCCVEHAYDEEMRGWQG